MEIEVTEMKKTKKRDQGCFVNIKPEEHAMLKLLCQIKDVTIVDYMTNIVKNELDKYRENLELLIMAREEIKKIA